MESKFRITAGLAEVKTMNGKEFQWKKYDADSIRGPSELEKYLYDKILKLDEDEKPRSLYVGRARIREERSASSRISFWGFMATARKSSFSSSRTFPGQEYALSTRRAPADKPISGRS